MDDLDEEQPEGGEPTMVTMVYDVEDDGEVRTIRYSQQVPSGKIAELLEALDDLAV